jgi:Uma2 family endonuclease
MHADRPGSGGTGRQYTRVSRPDLIDNGWRHEMVAGSLVVTPAPGRHHQRAVKRLTRILDSACPPGMEVLAAPFAVGLAEDTVLQPDVVVGFDADFTEQDLAGAPVLAIEVVSPDTRVFEACVKRACFERAGTPSFWLLEAASDPRQARLVVWELDSTARYREVAVAVGDEVFVAQQPFRVTVVPSNLVRDRGAAQPSPGGDIISA